MTGTKCSTGTADFPRVGSPLVNWPCLTHSSPTSYAAKDVLHTRTISIGSHNCHFLRIFKLVSKLSSSEAQTMSIGNWAQHGEWTANSFDIRATSSFIHKEQQSMAGDLCLVSWCAGTHSRPTIRQRSTSKRGCFFLSQLVHKRSLRDRISPLCDSNMVSVLTRHSAGTCLLSFKRR
jgi:hypothetical protein